MHTIINMIEKAGECEDHISGRYIAKAFDHIEHRKALDAPMTRGYLRDLAAAMAMGWEK